MLNGGSSNVGEADCRSGLSLLQDGGSLLTEELSGQGEGTKEARLMQRRKKQDKEAEVKRKGNHKR